MKRLSGLDATFLYLETPSAPMHVSGVFVADPATGVGDEVAFWQGVGEGQHG